MRLFILLFLCLCGTGNATEAWKSELQQIDQELKELEDQKTGYLSTARRLDDKGMSWQSQDQTQEAKRAYQRADDYREAAKMLQPRIDALNEKKAKILQEHPAENALP
jgi:hypothetical protein